MPSKIYKDKYMIKDTRIIKKRFNFMKISDVRSSEYKMYQHSNPKTSADT